MANINLGVSLNFDDSNYKKGVKSVEQSLKKFSTSTAFVKLKLDDSDFRKQYQDIVKESIKNIEKSDALSYRTKGGKLKKADSIGTMQTAYKYNLEQSVNSQLSKKEQNIYAKRAEYLQAHLNLIKEIGLETNSQLKAQAQIAAMPARLAQARRSGEVAAAKSKAAKEISALEKEKQLKKEIYDIDEKLDANAKSDKSEKAKLEEEVRLLSMKVKFLREQDKLAGIPQATPSAELEQTQKRLNQVKAIQRLNTLYNTQNGILTRLRNVAGQYFSLHGIIRFGQKVAEITGYYQKQQIALEGILGSATKAQSAINQLKQKALESPFMVKQLVTYTKQLAAFGIEYDNLIPTVSKLADVSVGLGVDMDRIILAYGQVKSATVLRGQELRQFTEAGIPMVEELAKKFTALNGELVTTADIFDLISKRQVSFDMVKKVMSDLTSEGGKFYKMQENITNTLAGQIEKLKDIWDAELNRIGEESGNVFTGIVKFLQQIVKNTKSVSWAMMVMIPTSYIVREFARIKMEFMKLDAAQQQQAGNMWKHASKMGSLLKGIGGLAITAGLGIAIGLIAKAIDNATRLRKELEKVGEAFNKETTKMISGLDSLTKKITAAKIGTKEYNDAVETLATNYGDFISTDIIKALQSQGDAAHQTAIEFAKIAENVKEAIKSYNEYKEIKEKQEVAKDEISNPSKRQFRALLNGAGIDFKTSIGSDFEEYYGRTGSNRDIRNEIIKLFSASTNEFLSGDDLSKEEFYRIFEERIKDIFPNIDNNTLSTIIERGFVTLVRNQGSGKNLLTPFLDLKSAEQHTEYYGMNKYFDTVDPSKTVYDNGDQIEYQNNLEAAYIEALHNTLKEKLGEQLPKEISDMLDRTYGKFGGRSIATDFNNNTVANINKVLYELKNTFTNNPDMQNWIAQVQGIFKTKVSEKTGRAAIVSDLMENSHFRYSGVQSVRGLWGQYNPNNENYEQLRNRIKTDYDSRVAEKESYISHGGKDKERIAQIDAEIEALKELASVEYYNVDLSSKKGGGNKNKYEKIRITDFMNELLSLTTKAEDATKKIIGVTGYTGELGEFVEGLKPGNFLKGFFEEGGNPFEEILGKMSEFGVTDFLPNLNAESLKAIFKNAGWEEGKEMSVPDFRAIYENVIKEVGGQALEGLKKKRETVAKDSPEYNSINAAIDALQENQIRALENMTTRWGGDEIEKRINLAIKELTNIGSKLDDIKSQRSMYERISKSSNPLIAKNALPDVSGYFSDSRYTSDALREMLQNEGGAGIASTLVGERLKSLLKGGSFNIDNLSALFEIIRDLEEQAGEKEITLADGKKIANSDQFKDTTSKVVDVINKLVESILKEYDKLAQYKTGDLKISDEILQAAEDFKNALKEIEETEKDPERAASMKLSATQQYYDKVLKSLGGSETPDWIKNMFGDKDAFGGVSGSGRFMKGLSGSNSLLDMVIQSKTAGINKQYAEGVFGEVGSADAMQGAADKLAGAANSAAGSIAMVDAIIKAVYQAINAVVELGKGILEVDAKVNNKLELKKGADGKLYDKDGNLNISEEYYEKQNNREIANQALDTIGHFNDHVMSGWEKLKSGDVLGAVTETVMSIADLIGDIVGVGDTKIRQQQDELIRSNENLARSMEGLEDALEDAAGIYKFDVQSQQIMNLQSQKANAEMLLEWENQKKNGDDAKAQDYADQAVEAQRQIDEIMDNIQHEVLGTADQLASTLTDPLVDAFRNGENAARAWRDAVKSYVSDVLKDILMTKVVAPKIQEILDQFMGDNTSSDDILSLFKDEEKVGGLVDSLNDVGTGLIDDFNNLPSGIKDLIGFNSEQSSLSGGISGITEDTARQLEGLANSMLMQQIIGNSHLASMSSHLIATIQISWFNGMLEQAKATRIAAENLDRAISDMRNGIRPMSVTMV